MFGKHSEKNRKAQHDQMLAASGGTSLPYQTPAQANTEDPELAELSRLELEEHKILRDELLFTGSEGSATVLSIFEMGTAVPPLVGYLIDVEVKPVMGGPRFTRSLADWLDPRTNRIVAGSTVQVRYDPQDTSRIIIQ